MYHFFLALLNQCFIRVPLVVARYPAVMLLCKVCLLLHLAVLVHHDTDAAEVVSHIEMVFRLAVSDSAVTAVEEYAVEFAVHDDKRTGILRGAVYKQRKGINLVPYSW